MKWASYCAARSRSSLPTEPLSGPAIPLAGWANGHLTALARASGSSALTRIDGATLLGERAMLGDFSVPGQISAGGGCRLFQTIDGWIALNLARPDDRDLLPALFCDDALDGTNDDAVARRIAQCESLPLVGRGREMGLAIAAEAEPRPTAASACITAGIAREGDATRPPLVVDLSALWAGPLAAHLLWQAGARVVKIESRTRPDAMRNGDPALFDLLNQGKASVALDFRKGEDRRALLSVLSSADIVIEAARPRALLQLGIDADQIVRSAPGMTWITITGHGATGEAASWVGFGDDCGVAGGLTTALHRASGKIGFVGDAIADPLTGILAARLAWERLTSGEGGRVALSMSGTVAAALDAERERDGASLNTTLKMWAEAEGRSFPQIARRHASPARPLGSDTKDWPC